LPSSSDRRAFSSEGNELDELDAAIATVNATANVVKRLGLFEFIIVVAVVVGFIIFWKVLLPVMMKKSELKAHDEIMSFQNLVSEVKQIVENYDDRFKKLEEGIIDVDAKFDKLGTDLSDLSNVVTNQGEFQGVLSQGVLEHQLYDDKYPSMLNRLKAFYRLTAMGINGRVFEKGFILIMNNKDLWLDVASMKEMRALKIENRKYFDDTMAEISRRIFDKAA
jgi:cell division protein FtsL